MFRRYGFFRDMGAAEDRCPDDIVQPHGSVFAHLARLGIAPGEIDHIVFTHLHADHHGMDDATDGGAAEKFENATIHVSRTGWNDNLRKRVDGAWHSYVDFAFGDFLMRREKEGKVRFADDEEIFPGLRTIYLGGHSICSQGVVVDTPDGTAVIASDDVYLYRLLEKRILPAIRTSRENYWRAVDRLVETARKEDGVIIPVHDPLIWGAYEKAGTAWVQELRAISDRAVQGYLEQARP
jgi:glyoxylase-like metal-dependent hydrolase (beta-lactamase superfamily II)